MKLTNNKPVVVLQLKLLTATWVLEWKDFLGNVTIMYTVKALRKSYGPPVTLRRLFQFKKSSVQRIY